MTIDPTLRLDLLAKLQDEGPAGGARNLFQFGPAPPPKADLPKGPEPHIVPAVFVGPRQRTRRPIPTSSRNRRPCRSP